MDRTTLKYCPYYCEENIWHLCQEPELQRSSSRVIFISNETRQCAFSNQSVSEDGFIVWDYHVILLSAGMIWDFDTRLPFPTPLDKYLKGTFPSGVASMYKPCFRVVDCLDFIDVFASDRRHMINQFGAYNSPPPSWPAIRTEKGSNLDQFIDMTNPFMGKIHRAKFI